MPKQTSFTFAEKRLVCLYHQEHPTHSQSQLITHFSHKFGRSISQSMISRTIKQLSIILNPAFHQDLKTSRLSKSPFPDLEQKLFELQQTYQEHHLPITRDILKSKAHQIWQRLPQYQHFEEPNWSNGWLTNFQRRFQLRSRRIYGEAADVPITAEEEMQKLRLFLRGYQPEDIYNMDETGLFWKATPSHSITNERIAGRKQDKSRVTIILACNSTGSDKVPIWVIGKSTKPRSFGRNNTNINKLQLVYKSQRKAWINTEICIEWLQQFAHHINSLERKICLLWDNHSSHIGAALAMANDPLFDNITIRFLPKNSTSIFQPLDQGIINTTKAYYKQKILERMIYSFDNLIPFNIQFLDAMTWISISWNLDITPETIRNC